jgi:VWFA-related protein
MSSTLIFAVSFAAAQEPIQPDPVVTIQAHARAVVLDVIVRDNHGHPVHGLTEKDFNMLEDGVSQRIASFDEQQTGQTTARPMLQLPPNTFSNANRVQDSGTATVLLLDAIDTAAPFQMYAREQLIRWVNSTPALRGPTAVFALNPDLRQIQGFTTDVDVLRAAVKERAQIMLSPLPAGRGFVATSMRVGAFSGGMQSLAQYLAGFPGHKNVIWFTGGTPERDTEQSSFAIPTLGFGDRATTYTFDYGLMADTLRLSRVSLYPVDAEGLRTDPAFDASKTRAPTNGEIMAFGVHQGEKHEELEDIAEATGGKAFYNTNDIKGAIDQVIETGTDYYTLSYYPSNKVWDGKYRKLKIELAQEGDHLEYRRGYFAVAEAAKKQPSQPANANTINMRRQITNHAPDGFWHTMHLGVIDPGSIVFRVHVAPEQAVQKLEKGQPLPQNNYLEPKFRDKPFREYDADFVVDGKQLQISPSADGLLQGKVEFALVVLDDKGTLVNIYDATVEMNIKPSTYDYMMKNGARFPARIAIPVKGNYFIRAGVHDVFSTRAGALEMNISEIK